MSEDPRRIFVYAVAFHGRRLNFVRMDRGCLVATRDLSLDDAEDTKLAITCIRSLVSLLFAESAHHLRGYDFTPTTSFTPKEGSTEYQFHGTPFEFTIYDKKFALTSCITWREELRGRATRTFLASATNPPITFPPHPLKGTNGWSLGSEQEIAPPQVGSDCVVLRFVHHLRSSDIEARIIRDICQFADK